MNAIKIGACVLFYPIKTVVNNSFLIYCPVCTLWQNSSTEKNLEKEELCSVLYSVKMWLSYAACLPSVLHSKGNTPLASQLILYRRNKKEPFNIIIWDMVCWELGEDVVC